MRHQTALEWGADTNGSSRRLRLDPFALPLRYTASLDRDGNSAEAVILLDRRQALVRRATVSGLPVSVRIPLSAFEGIAVRMVPVGTAGDIEVTVELHHRDPALCLPLVICDDPAEVAADWQAWSRALGLPLLLVRQDGSVDAPLNQMGEMTLLPTKPRRRHSFFAGRRPRFLTRRKPGGAITLERVSARESIARD